MKAKSQDHRSPVPDSQHAVFRFRLHDPGTAGRSPAAASIDFSLSLRLCGRSI
jgi:hypothetical protein